ncbi:hypothetical protein FJZ28_02910, partial [Candidatus Peregrinibacteria bacterium]|nr:hypothetical protein [Candidatus Peregrinibacteria bacterium]
YVSRNKIGPWLEHVMSGKRTLAELKRFIGDWAKVRYGFDRTERAMNKGTVPRGFNRLTEEKFLGLSYEQRRSYVEEAERRLHAEGSHVPHTNFTVLKGKIRHALDTEDWDEARQYLQEAWKGNNSEEDIRELQSMENYLKSFGKKEKKQEKKDPKTEVLRAASDIDGLLASAPDGLKPFYEKCLLYGGEATASMCQIIYNVKWCQDRNYLPDEPNILRHRALRETEHRLSAAGDGHKNGLENNLVTGFNSPSIRDDGFGPQNMFATKDESQTVAQKASEHKDDFTFRYWSNLIVPDVSRGQYHFASTQIHWRLKRAARTLEAHGFKYGTMELKAFRSLHASGASEAA